MFSAGFGVGLIVGFALTVVALRYFEREYPAEKRVPVAGGVPYSKRKSERKKPIVIDELKEYQIEQDQLKKS